MRGGGGGGGGGGGRGILGAYKTDKFSSAKFAYWATSLWFIDSIDTRFCYAQPLICDNTNNRGLSLFVHVFSDI